MAVSERRKKQQAEKKARKAAAMRTPGFKSKYARKVAFLKSNGGWGFDYPSPKPWGGAS